MRIYKYPLTDPSGVFAIEMPKGAKILTIQMQYGTPCIWALVDPGKPNEIRRFRMYGTGHEMGSFDLPYIGTFQIDSGRLVFHLFEG